MIHCRAATPGVGSPQINRNNHPFVSNDRTISLIHNGKVPEPEYKALSSRYELFSKCDSEILLRVFEAGKDRDNDSLLKDFPDWSTDISVRLAAIRDIWSYMSSGVMAVAIGEWLPDGVRRLWFFRNKYRSLWFADLRHTLGQVFFFSTPKIWHDAINDCNLLNPYLINTKIIELPTDEIWTMQISPDQPVLEDCNLAKFTVKTNDIYLPWKLNGDSFKLDTREPPVKIITKLDNDENVIAPEKPVDMTVPRTRYFNDNTPSNCYQYDKGVQNGYNVDLDLSELDSELFYDVGDQSAACGKLDDSCKALKQLIEDIEISGNTKIMEGSLQPSDFTDLIEQLDQITLDLKGSLRMVEC